MHRRSACLAVLDVAATELLDVYQHSLLLVRLDQHVACAATDCRRIPRALMKVSACLLGRRYGYV
ncbi:hypothetical protein CWO90_09160 [Bradyrhizobium sp. Leo121]|nr:hypothetical protein CWO90_09160 [Bradyrhizobium sp. Leo121]